MNPIQSQASANARTAAVVLRTLAIALILAQPVAASYERPADTPADIRTVLQHISEDSLRAHLTTLVGFGTRNTFSDTVSETRGIGAARRWIHKRFRQFSAASGGRLRVSFDYFDQPLNERSQQATGMASVRTANVVAVLPGTSSERQFIVSGHYDSMNGRSSDGEIEAHGANDDGSGTVVALELARVLSRYEFEHTLVFIAFTGEEQGLWGSRHFAGEAKESGAEIGGMITNDIVGNTQGGNGSVENNRLRCFSPDPMDSKSRQLARYIRETAMHHVPGMRMDLIFRLDRFGRGGDHRPFAENGFAGVRFTEPAENYSRQHNPHDTLGGVDFAYLMRVARVNAAVLASAAQAPRPPQILSVARDRETYHTVIIWNKPDPAEAISHYNVRIRKTTEPFWTEMVNAGPGAEMESRFAGAGLGIALPHRTIDEYVFGVEAVDKDGFTSLVGTFDLDEARRRWRARRQQQRQQEQRR